MVMFISDTHLPQLLPAKAYSDEGWYKQECEKVFHDAWWAIAFSVEFQNDRDFLTVDLPCGPVVLWQRDGVIRAFLNVCAHRLSRLTSKTKGCCDTLVCEYHGWEYAASGKTKRIPDAPSFRPLEKDGLGLRPLCVEVVGGIVFVSQIEGSPSIQSHLGQEETNRLCRRDRHPGRVIYQADLDIPVNWKVLVENNLESYHVGFVHRATLGEIPDGDLCTHKIIPGGSMFFGPGSSDVVSAAGRQVARQAHGEVESRYIHGIAYPTFMWTPEALGTSFQTVIPTGPKSCRIRWRILALQGERKRHLLNLLARCIAKVQAGFWRRVVNEDVEFLPSVQVGVESLMQPSEGLVSRREERIFHFQKWLANRIGYVKTNDFVGSA